MTTCSREPLVETIVRFVSHDRAADTLTIRASVERAIDEAGVAAIEALSARLTRAGTDWDYYPRDPLARHIHRALAPCVLNPLPVISGVENVNAAADKPLVIVANHLSYSDANVIDVVLGILGADQLADRMTVVAGPKVYSNIRRRFSSLCFGTIKVPQSSERASGEAVMNTRDVAKAARHSIQIAHQRLKLGEALMIFPEGSRSRSGQMQPFLSGTARYFDSDGIGVLPVGISGMEALFPIDGAGLRSVALTVNFGRVISAGALREHSGGNRKLMMDYLGSAVARLLPLKYRGVYA